ncbi:MAG: PsbP-related protein [Candidatus Promineifilaceae bacterium]
MPKKFLNNKGNVLTVCVTTFIFIIVFVFGTGCQDTESRTTIVPSTRTPLSPTPTIAFAATSLAPTNTPSNSPFSTHTLEPIVSPTPIHEEWLKYENNVYGFSFYYPTDWTPIELQNKVAVAVQGLSISLKIGVRQITEDVQLVRTGVPAGDLVMRGTVTFLGQALVKNVLVYQGKDKAVLYNSAGEIEVNDLVFVISLESNRFDYESIQIPETIQEQADQILESFELTNK